MALDSYSDNSQNGNSDRTINSKYMWLKRKHHALEMELEAMKKLKYLTPNEEMEMKRKKQKKLQYKHQMAKFSP